MNRTTIIGIISANVAFWAIVLFIGSAFVWEIPPFSTEDGTFRPTMFLGLFFNALVFYANALWLYPLSKKKKLRIPYWFCAIFLILVTAVIESFLDFELAKQMGLIPKIEEIMSEGEPSVPASFAIVAWIIRQLFVHGFYFLLSFSLIFVLNVAKQKEVQEKLEKEKLNAELKFLKAQINPHFLFNGINSVYHLIDPKPAIAKDTLLKFSNLLRYQLYECNDDFIPLEKELAHIQDYVEMEKIRKGEDASIQLKLPEDTYGIMIPPLLFTPFIENAFKYVSNHDDGEKNNIAINVRLIPEENKLRFETHNTVDENGIISKGGIGIPNVKKRLALLFPNRHDLDLIKEPNHFVVRMSLNLKKETS